jgi:hypothetical protein
VAADPYLVLGVSREAGDSEIKRCYERRLSEAMRNGAIRTAQDVDVAYSVLRDPRRRALFDRHGLADPLPNSHPLQPSARPPVPFRFWAPAQNVQLASAPPDMPRCQPAPQSARRSRATWVVAALVGALILGAYLEAVWPKPGISTTYSITPASPSGTVQVICAPTSAGAGYSFTAISATAVRCSNGAAPQFDPLAVGGR